MRKDSLHALVVALACAPWLGCLACSDDDANDANDAGANGTDGGSAVAAGPPKPVVQAKVVPFPFTSVLSAEAGALLTEFDAEAGTLAFEGKSAELDALAADRIVVVPPGPHARFGLLRRIDAVERDGDKVMLSTRETSIVYAFREVDITVEAGGPEDGANLPTFSSALSVDSKGKFPFVHDVDWVVFDGDKDPATTEDRVLVTGELQAAVGYTFHLGFNWGALKKAMKCLDDPDISCLELLNPLELAAGIGLEVTFVADLSAGADLNVAGAAALSFAKEIQLAEPVYLTYIQAGPIGITPRLVATAGVEGGATAKVDINVEVSGGVEFGLKAEGASVWPIGKGAYLDTPSGDSTIQATAYARAWVHPRVELLFYTALGPSIGLQPYAEVRADTDQDPCWHLEGGLDATLGITLAAGPATLIDEHATKNLTKKEFASGECPLPGGPGGGSLDPTFDPWASGLTGSLYSSGSQGDSTALAPTHDGKFLFTASTSSGLLKLDAEGKPEWIRRYVRDELDTLYPERAVSLLDASLLVVGRSGAVLRTDELGALLESHVLDIADDDNTHIGAIARTDAGGAWVAGDTPLPGGGADGWLARFAPDGSLIDAFAIRGPYDERPKSIVLLADGGALIAGEAFDAGSFHGWAARIAADGSTMWFVRLVDCATEPGLGEDDISVYAASLTHDGNFALAGYTFYPDYRGMLVKLREQDGGLAWGQTYSLANGLGLQLEAVASLESGGFLLGGTQVDIGPNDAIALAETDSAGNVAWMLRYDGPGRDGHVSLWRTPADNGVLLGATAEGLSATEGASSAFVLKVPRKDGELAFDANKGALVDALMVGDAGVCLAVEPYAGGVIEPLPAVLMPLPKVVDESVDVESLQLD